MHAASATLLIPPITHPCWIRLAKGELNYLRTHHLPTELMLDRVRHSALPVMLKAHELFCYFSKWGDDLPNELAQIRAV